MNIKIGHGYDVHKLVKGRRLILGGVDIEHSLGLLGHSDADVLCHAVADSLLGAAGKRISGIIFRTATSSMKAFPAFFFLKRCEKSSKKADIKSAISMRQ